MYRSNGKVSETALTNLKMRAASTHYGDVLKGTQLGSLLNKSLMPDEEINLSEELALTRHMAGEAAKDYAKALAIKEVTDTPQTRELVSYASAILNEKLKAVKDMCESQGKLHSTIRRLDPAMLNFGDILNYVMGVMTNHSSSTLDTDAIEVELRNEFKSLSDDSSNDLISKPSDDKIIEQMDNTIPKQA